MRRVLLWSAVILTALLLQSTIFAQIRLAGAKPDLIYLVTIALAYLEGPSSGAIAGFAGGMAEDFLLNQPKGITALTLTLLGYAVGLLRSYVASPSPFLPVLIVGGGTSVGVLFFGLVTFLLGEPVGSAAYLVRVALLTGVYNAILTPLIFPIIRRVVDASRTRRVYRW
ncbi:MAG TPA: rod shape-determining protein MreD [Actinomycetota bacterium]